MTAPTKNVVDLPVLSGVVVGDKLIVVDVSDTTEGPLGTVKVATLETIDTIFDASLAEAAASASTATTQASNSAASAALAAAIALGVASGRPTIRPALNLDFVNSDTIDPRITFTRASSGVYYDGKTYAKAEENLLLNSATVVTQNITTRAEAHTLSFTGTGTVTLTGTSTSGPLVGTGAADRVSLTFTPTAGTLTLTVSGTVQDGQIEVRSSVTAYTPTTTQPITNYIMQLLSAGTDVWRPDYDPVTGVCNGRLIEPAATNLLTYSEDFSDAAWTKTACSISSNQCIAIDGTITVDKIVENTASGARDVRQSHTGAGGTYTQSVFAKYAGRVLRVVVLCNSDASSAYCDFDLSSGTMGTPTAVGTGVSAVSATIEDMGNGVYRCVLTATYATTLTRTLLRPIPSVGYDAVAIYTGDGYSGVYVWGAQLEAGPLTSYIKTVAATVTRAADLPVMTGANFSSWYNAVEGTFLLKVKVHATGSGSSYPMVVGNSDLSKSISISRTPVTLSINADSYEAGASNSMPLAAVADGAEILVAYGYKRDDFGASINGAAVVADTSRLIPAGIDRLGLGALTGGAGGEINGSIAQLIYWPKKLTSAEIQILSGSGA